MASAHVFSLSNQPPLLIAGALLRANGTATAKMHDVSSKTSIKLAIHVIHDARHACPYSLQSHVQTTQTRSAVCELF